MICTDVKKPTKKKSKWVETKRGESKTNKDMLTKEDIIVNIEAVCDDMVLVLDNNHDPIWMKEEDYDRIIKMH